jgi:hypothetical protein
MTSMQTPDSLSPGSLVGPWCIERPAGQGTFGVVYRAVRAGHPGSEPVALKIANSPQDPRFVREVHLLSRIQHPAVPRMQDRGWWQPAGGPMHPYLVMQWVEGLPLYEWAHFARPSSLGMLRVIAQVAWALAATHAAKAVHRDVKGDNVLVTLEGQAFLMDFGAGTWEGAPRLTFDGPLPPGTREYRAPQPLRFHWEFRRHRTALYAATPADDVYALGVTAYRLVTGVYPPPGTDPELRRAKHPVARPLRLLPQALNARVTPELAALIERMLAEEPEARGTARQIAEAAEEAVRQSSPRADGPLVGAEPRGTRATRGRAMRPSAGEVRESAAPREPTRAHKSGQAVAAAGVLLAMGLFVVVSREQEPGATEELAPEQPRDAGSGLDGGTQGVGEEVLSAPVAARVQPHSRRAIELDMPRKPLPGQIKPDKKGVCLSRAQIVINGGCWHALRDARPPCGEDGYEWQGDCYTPVMEKLRQPTSEPRESTP